jgi:hypothetical protein
MTAARSFDDIDRLAFRLARTVCTQYPQLVTQGFTLADLEERLLPFRDARREMADSSVDGFERSVLRLVSGERGYLQTEAALQAACTRALASASPSMSLVRVWATAALKLTPSATATAMDAGRMPPPVVTAVHEEERDSRTLSTGCGCRYCGHRLPEQRAITFCPHCGLDLTKRQCPACSTELDVHWRFCVTCGRGADLPELLLPLRRAS